MNLSTVQTYRFELIGTSFVTPVQKKPFEVIDITGTGIQIRPGKSKTPRAIAASAVNSMGDQWSEYKAGRIKRSEIANGKDANYHTSYIEAIFREIEKLSSAKVE